MILLNLHLNKSVYDSDSYRNKSILFDSPMLLLCELGNRFGVNCIKL